MLPYRPEPLPVLKGRLNACWTPLQGTIVIPSGVTHVRVQLRARGTGMVVTVDEVTLAHP